MAEPSMTFWEHLEVLRWSIFRIAIAAVMAMVVIFIFMPSMFTGFVLGPTTSEFFLYKWLGSLGQLPFLPDFAAGDFKVDIISINVASQFMTHISTSFWFALVAIFPYIIYEIWKFIAPALYDNEKGKKKMMASYNLAVYYEAHDDTGRALEYLEEAMQL